MAANPYKHNPQPHLNGPIMGRPQPGTPLQVPPSHPVGIGTNVGGNPVQRAIANLSSLFGRKQY